MGWHTQSREGDDLKVEVNSASDSARGDTRTDFLIFDRETGAKEHVAIDENGNVAYPGHNPDNVDIKD